MDERNRKYNTSSRLIPAVHCGSIFPSDASAMGQTSQAGHAGGTGIIPARKEESCLVCWCWSNEVECSDGQPRVPRAGGRVKVESSLHCLTREPAPPTIDARACT